MSTIGNGNMASQLQLSLTAARLKADTTRLSQEVASGQRVDVGAPNSRDTAQLASLHRTLGLLRTFESAVAETGLVFNAAQTALGAIQDQSETSANDFIVASGTNHPTQLAATAVNAEMMFKSVVGRLNTRIGGQALFAGDATDQTALADGDAIMTALRTAIAGDTNATSVAATLTDWFMTPGGGFDTMAYQGSTTPAGALPIGQGESVSPDFSAADPEIRQVLLGYAMGAMVGEPAIANSVGQAAVLVRHAGEALATGVTQLTGLRAGIGASEAQIESAKVRVSTEALSTEQAISTLTSVDPYRAATELQDAMSRMEALYTVTARMARLSLTEYLR